MNEYLARIKTIIKDKIIDENLSNKWIDDEENFDFLFYSDIKTDDILTDIQEKNFGGTPAISDEDLANLVREFWSENFNFKRDKTMKTNLEKRITRAHLPMISKIKTSEFIIKKTILSYIVDDYDEMCHSFNASERFPFIKLTSRKGEVFYKVYNKFRIPEEWFVQDEEIDYLIKFQTSMKMKKNIDDMFSEFYIKKITTTRGGGESNNTNKPVIIIEKDDNVQHAPYFKEILKYTTGKPVSEMFNGECFITNSLFNAENAIYFTDFIFFHSKYFEFDESQNTVGAKKERYYLKRKNSDIRISFTKIYDDSFTLNINRVKKGSEKKIIEELVEDFYEWHQKLSELKAEYEDIFKSLDSDVAPITTEGAAPKKAPVKTKDTRLNAIKAEYKKAGKIIPADYSKNCQKQFQPYILTDENRDEFNDAVNDPNNPAKSNPDIPSSVHHDGFEWACVPRRDHEEDSYYPYIKKKIEMPCCSRTPIKSTDKGGVYKATNYIKSTTNKEILYGERGALPSWWGRLQRLFDKDSDDTGSDRVYLKYSLGKGSDINNDILLRCVLYATDKKFPKKVSEEDVKKYIAKTNHSETFPDVIHYNEHIAELSRVGNINIVVFKDENIYFNEATPSFDKNLNTLVLFETSSLLKTDIYPSYVMLVDGFNPLFTSKNEKMYSFFEKLYESYKTYYIVDNTYKL